MFYGVPTDHETLKLTSYNANQDWMKVPQLEGAIELSNKPFLALICVQDWYHGRSAAGYKVRVEGHPSDEIIEANMGMRHFFELLSNCDNVVISHEELLFESLVKFTNRGASVFVEVSK